MKETAILTLALIILVSTPGLQGCGGEETKTLRLFCGAGIRPPVDEIIKLFKDETGIEVKPTYAGGGALLTQIQLNRQGDLYMPGDEEFISRAEGKGLISEKRDVAYFVPVILVQKGNPKGIKSIADLAKPGVRIAMGDPKACAVGGVTEKILKRAGIEDQVKRNVVYTGVTVQELGNAVKLKTVDAAIVWDATAKFYPDSTEAIRIPEEQNVIARIPIGILSFSKHKKEAEKFLDFITSERARRIFEKHGYTTKL